MYSVTKHPAERRADRCANQVEIEVGHRETRELLALDGYDKASGLLVGKHFRKERGDGCYHLRVTNSGATLHWDRWDPRRFPLRHFFETPALWGTTAALTVVTLAFLGSRDD